MTWHWALVVLHGTQPTGMEHPQTAPAMKETRLLGLPQ